MLIPVILAIDVEPDARLVNRYAPEPWIGYELSQRYLRDLRPRLEALTGAAAHLSWFLRLDPQVAQSYGSATWVVDRYRDHIEEIQQHGDEIGVHPHAYRWLEDEGTWLNDYGNQAWVDTCLRVSLEAFEAALGRPCRSMRYGDRWMNTPTVNLAEELGICYDLTVEPGAPALPTPMPGERGSAPLPDYYRVPRHPWTPSAEDFRRSAPARRIRMIPLTSGHLRLGLRPRRHLRRLLANGIRHRRQDTPLSMWRSWTGPNTFDRMLDRALAAQSRPYLAFAIRTDFALTPSAFEAVDACVRALLAHPAAENFRFSTPDEALALLDDDEAGGGRP